jgi:hypothetical protein
VFIIRKKKQGKFALTERLVKNTKLCQPNNKIIPFFNLKNGKTHKTLDTAYTTYFL